MIRDEFKNQQQKKKLSEKDLMKIRSMGERAYYTSSIVKMKNTLNNMKFLIIFAWGFAVILTATMAVILTFYKGFNGNISNILSFVICLVLWAIIIVWYFVLKPYYKKRIVLFGEYVKDLTDKEMAKQQAIYNKFIKQKPENNSDIGE